MTVDLTDHPYIVACDRAMCSPDSRHLRGESFQWFADRHNAHAPVRLHITADDARRGSTTAAATRRWPATVAAGWSAAIARYMPPPNPTCSRFRMSTWAADDFGRVVVAVPRARTSRVVHLGMRAELGPDRIPGVITAFDSSDVDSDPTLWVTLGGA